MTKNTKMILGWVVSVIIAATGAFCGGMAITSNQSQNQAVAVNINGQEVSVTAENFQKAYNELERKYNDLQNQYERLLSGNKNLQNNGSEASGNNEASIASVPVREDNGPVYVGEDIKTLRRRESGYYEYSPGDGESFSISGVKYYRGIYAVHDYAWGLYNLQGKYTKLTGIIGHVDGTGMDNGVVRFYGDGKLILEYELFADALGAYFSLDVTEITQLKIEFNSGNWTAYALADAQFS